MIDEPQNSYTPSSNHQDQQQMLPASTINNDLRAISGMPPKRRIPTTLNDGEVFVFDDERGLLNLATQMLVRFTDLAPNKVTGINPLSIYRDTVDSESRIHDTLIATITPVVQAANDPARGVSLVLTDFEMGVITGQMLIAALQEELGEDLPFRVILHSANADLASSSPCFRDAFIPKPLDVSILKEHLANFYSGE